MLLKFKVLICRSILLIHLFFPILNAEVREIKSFEELSLIRTIKRRPILRIVGGIPATLGDVPYQVALKNKAEGGLYTTFCGGTIVGKSVILSAAHCFDNKKPSCCEKKGQIKYLSARRFYAVAGNLRNQARYKADSIMNGQWRQLSSIRYPVTYNFPFDDIAVVKTTKPFRFNRFIRAIPYASINREITGLCKISGYGQISPKIKSDSLLMAYVNILPDEECQALHRKNMSNIYCTDESLAGVDKGDSGGPLVCTGIQDLRENGSLGILVGVTSAKVEFALDGRIFLRSSLFTKVAMYGEFLNKSDKVNNSKLIGCVCFCTVLLNIFFSMCLTNFYFTTSEIY